jgi:hypothetical protein
MFPLAPDAGLHRRDDTQPRCRARLVVANHEDASGHKQQFNLCIGRLNNSLPKQRFNLPDSALHRLFAYGKRPNAGRVTVRGVLAPAMRVGFTAAYRPLFRRESSRIMSNGTACFWDLHWSQLLRSPVRAIAWPLSRQHLHRQPASHVSLGVSSRIHIPAVLAYFSAPVLTTSYVSTAARLMRIQ